LSVAPGCCSKTEESFRGIVPTSNGPQSTQQLQTEVN
jgi:hypothetical protein